MSAYAKQEASFAMPAHYTPIPNEYIDSLMRQVTPIEWGVLTIILRYTEGWHRQSAAISVADFVAATTMSATSVRNALKTLEQRGIIAGLRQIAPNGGTLPTRYRVIVPVERQAAAPLQDAPTPMQQPQPHDKDMILKTIPKQKAAPPAMIALLFSLGISEADARLLAALVASKGYGVDFVQAWCADIKQRTDITRPAGFLRAMAKSGAWPATKTPPSSGGASWWQSYKERYGRASATLRSTANADSNGVAPSLR